MNTGGSRPDVLRMLDRIAELERALDLMLQAFDPDHPAACHQECFDTPDGHGYEMQDHAKKVSRAALGQRGASAGEPT
jgi:hypothetical protein